MLYKDKVSSLLGVVCNYSRVKSNHCVYALIVVSQGCVFCLFVCFLEQKIPVSFQGF